LWRWKLIELKFGGGEFPKKKVGSKTDVDKKTQKNWKNYKGCFVLASLMSTKIATLQRDEVSRRF